jgi:pilus assembly protein CpaC
MYDTHRFATHWQRALQLGCMCLVVTTITAASSITACAADLQATSVVRKISELSDKLELTTNSSRILTLDKNIPRVQVNNPELLAVTPLSATQVQISAKKAGVTQVNLWDEDGKIHAVDVMIYGDARELEVALQTQFPHASIKVFRYSESLVLTGYVDRPDHVSPIMALAQDYSPKVINNIQVGGVQQILLKTKVMEISRTKLRRMGTDFSVLGSSGGFFSTGVSGLLQNTSNNVGTVQSVVDSTGKAAEFGIIHNGNAFFGFLDWLQQNNIAKILSDPNIVAVSGRPSQFNVGGEIPIVVPQSLGTASIEFKPFGTQIDFLPIVLGNGNIRLEIRPRISEIDDSRSVIVQNFVIPALTVRQVDTAVEMKAGQTFALAGLRQEKTKTQKRGLPYVSDVPVIGLPFRKMEDEVNEIELLIVVTPEFVDPIDACEVPDSGPGTFTTSPTNRGLYCAGHMEVPMGCNPTQGYTMCGQDPCNNNCGCNQGAPCNGCNTCGVGNGPMPVMTGEVQMQSGPTAVIQGGTGYDDSSVKVESPTTVSDQKSEAVAPLPAPQDITLPGGASESKPATVAEPKVTEQSKPSVQPVTPPQPAQPKPTEQPAGPMPEAAPPKGSSYYLPMQPNQANTTPVYGPGANVGAAADPSTNAAPTYTTPQQYFPTRQPVFVRNASRPNNPQQPQWRPATQPRENNLIGPVGYDIEQ